MDRVTSHLKRVWISTVVRWPLPWRSRHRNKYVNPSAVSLFSRASTKSRKLSKSISLVFPPPLLRRTCSSKTIESTWLTNELKIYMKIALESCFHKIIELEKHIVTDNKSRTNLFQWKFQSTSHQHNLEALACSMFHSYLYQGQETCL